MKEQNGGLGRCRMGKKERRKEGDRDARTGWIPGEMSRVEAQIYSATNSQKFADGGEDEQEIDDHAHLP